MRKPVLIACLVSASIALGAMAYRPAPPGCAAFTPADGLLVAHAGGGLPGSTYANNREALDLAASHGFRLFELDFRQKGDRLTIGHDEPSGFTLADLRRWLDEHPGAAIVTDIKTNNIAGLAILAREIGTPRLIPQIYQPDQLEPAKALGFDRIIFAERIGESRGWFPWVNDADLWAVTIPMRRKAERHLISKPTFLYTVNEPGHGNVYTDCLIPS